MAAREVCLRRRRPPWDRHTADELLDRLQLKPHAILTGFRSDIPELLATMHCLVFPSFKVEGTPQVLLQAMAMGIPIVATRIGGIPDLIEDGTMGRLVEPENPVALADAVQRVLEHREESLAAAQRARQRVLQNFSLDQAIERTASIYRELV